MYLYTYTHTYGTPKNIQTPIEGIVAVTKHTVLSHSLGWGRPGLDLHEHATPQSCRACTGDTMRPPAPSWGQLRKAGGRAKEVRLGMSPDPW